MAEKASPKDGGDEGAEEWTVCNHLIAIQTQVNCPKYDHKLPTGVPRNWYQIPNMTIYQFSSETEAAAKWSALDFSVDPPSYRSFEARFKSEQDARDFKVTNRVKK